MSGRANPGRRALFALTPLVLLLGLGELAARTLFADELAAAEGPPPQPEDGAPTMRGNPYLLWEQAPGVRVEHGVTANINSLGLRGPEPTIPKPSGVRRLLATGDSSVYGFKVADEQVFITRAAELLGGPAAGIEGWNAAIPGYSTYQTLNMLEMRAWSLEPDVLVIANVWSDNNFDSFVDKELINAYSTWDSGVKGRIKSALRSSSLYRLVTWELRVVNGDQAARRKVGWMVGDGNQIGKRRVEVNDYAANLERMVREARDHGAEVVFVVLANEDDMRGPRREPAAWTLYRQVIRDTAARWGAPVVDAPEAFLASGLGREALFLDEMHPTAQGHALIAEALAEALRPWKDGEPLMQGGTGGEVPRYEDHFTFGDGGPDRQGPPSPDPGGSPPRNVADPERHLRGTLRWTAASGVRIQVDAVYVASGGSQPLNLGNTVVGADGRFDVPIVEPPGPVGFVLYDDKTGDGPTADDLRMDLSTRTLEVGSGLDGIVIDADAGTVTGP